MVTNGGDTSIGGAHRSFPSTVWSAIEAAQGLTKAEARERIGRILAAYWKPIYVTIRAGWSKKSEDAKDLTQSFFAFLLEADAMSRVRRERGRFRGFLKTSLRNFLANRQRAESAIKRGGNETMISLESAAAELEAHVAASAQRPPDEIFDNEWARALLQGAREDFERSAESGRAATVEVFRLFQEAGPGEEGPVYERIAARLGVTRDSVVHHLQRARSIIRERVLARIREYAQDADELREELDLIQRAWL